MQNVMYARQFLGVAPRERHSAIPIFARDQIQKSYKALDVPFNLQSVIMSSHPPTLSEGNFHFHRAHRKSSIYDFKKQENFALRTFNEGQIEL